MKRTCTNEKKQSSLTQCATTTESYASPLLPPFTSSISKTFVDAIDLRQRCKLYLFVCSRTSYNAIFMLRHITAKMLKPTVRQLLYRQPQRRLLYRRCQLCQRYRRYFIAVVYESRSSIRYIITRVPPQQQCRWWIRRWWHHIFTLVYNVNDTTSCSCYIVTQDYELRFGILLSCSIAIRQ